MLVFFDFRIPQGGAAIYGRWGGNLCGVYIDNFFMNQLVKEYWKSVQICQSHHQTSRGILFWAMHKSLTGQKLTMPAHPTTKACWIGGEVWNRKPVFEKEPCWHTLSRSLITVRHAPLEIIMLRLCLDRKKFLAPPLIGDVTVERASQFKLIDITGSEKLKWNDNVANICFKLNKHL